MCRKKDAKQADKVASEKSMNNAKRMQKFFHTREDYALNVNLCENFLKVFIFRSIQRVETGLFYDTNRVGFVDRQFIYDTMEN